MIRGYIVEKDEYIYPNSEEFIDILEFYSYLEGYRYKGLTCIVDLYSRVNSFQGDKIYENDIVEVEFKDMALPIREGIRFEKGGVEFNHGSFWLRTKEDNLWEFNNVMFGKDLYIIKLLKGRYNPKTFVYE